MFRNWKLEAVDPQQVVDVAGHCRLPDPLARALILRGLHDPDEVEAFLHPRLGALSDPLLLPDMAKAVSRLWTAIDAGEAITVFGDYDVDGVTSTALLTRILTMLGARVRPFIPDRLDEGYGLSQEALERCIEEHGSSLLLTVDCGTNSTDSVAHAQSCGMDVIVTDHHEPDRHPAPAYALINPKLACPGQGRETGVEPDFGAVPRFYPGQENLSGVGVAFKLAHALLKSGREAGRAVTDRIELQDYLDIVALGTVTDLVPLTHENRILVRHGLAALKTTKWEGLRALKTVAGIHGEVDTYQLGFQLGPRINAAGRIGQPMQALRLLTTDHPAEAREIAALLDRNNLERRRLERDMAEAAFAEIDGYFDPSRHFGLVVARPGWHPGVVGIVASRVARRYTRPAIVLGIDEDGSARGSCRSIDEFDLLFGLRACDQHLAKYGGHKMAAGVEVATASLEPFKSAFNAAAAAVLKPLDLVPVQHIDAEVSADQLDHHFFQQLKQLHPFGQNNPEPVWALYGITLLGQPRVVGENHLKFALSCEGRRFEAIAFNYPREHLPEGRLDIAFTLKENNWNGQTDLQLQIRDIRAAAAS